MWVGIIIGKIIALIILLFLILIINYSYWNMYNLFKDYKRRNKKLYFCPYCKKNIERKYIVNETNKIKHFDKWHCDLDYRYFYKINCPRCKKKIEVSYVTNGQIFIDKLEK